MKKVLIFGTFDIVHMGHIHMMEEARQYGDLLIVAIARDCNVEKVKGIGALHTEEERLAFVSHIDLVDEVYLGYELDPYQIIQDTKPDVIALGYDQKVFVDGLAAAITGYGLSIQIVRLVPYKEQQFKSNKIRKYMERIV